MIKYTKAFEKYWKKQPAKLYEWEALKYMTFNSWKAGIRYERDKISRAFKNRLK